MFKNYTVDQWRDFAKQGGFIIDTGANFLLWGEQSLGKPHNWQSVLKTVNGNRAPIEPQLRDALFDLFDEIVPIDARDPWPALAQLKENNQLEMSLKDNNSIILQRIDVEKSVAVVVSGLHSADAVCAKWDGLGFEHERLIWFAALVSPFYVNVTDPWFGLMNGKKQSVHKRELLYEEPFICHVSDGEKAGMIHVPVNGGLKIPQLVQMYNDGDVPPGCATDWEPYLSVTEAMSIFRQVYGTPAFHALRFHNNKIRNG
jgi:hypothetical protein